MNRKSSVKNSIQVVWYISKLSNWGLILVGPLLLSLIWLLLTWTNVVNPLFLPRPEIVLEKLIGLLGGEIWQDIWSTLFRTLAGFIFAAIIGIPLGILLGLYGKLYRSSEVVIDFFRSLPSTALFPLFLLIFGIGNMAKIAVAIFVCFWIILLSAANGVIHSSRTRYKAIQILGASKMQSIYKVIFWEALPFIVTGLRVAFSIAIIVVIVTEMFIGTNKGLGQRIYDAYLMYRVGELYATLVIVGVLGYTINKLFIFLERRFIHWTGH